MINMTSTQKKLKQYWDEHHADWKKIEPDNKNTRMAVMVQFRGAKKVYKFNNLVGLDLHKGDMVLVLTHMPKDAKDRSQLQVQKAKVVSLRPFTGNDPETGKKYNAHHLHMPVIDKL